MVRGLDLFKSRFSQFSKNYVLIGGTACTLVMEERGLLFRATKDLDIVLCVEVLASDFVKAFWDFIRAGNYQYQQKSTGKKLLYRFHSPKDSSYLPKTKIDAFAELGWGTGGRASFPPVLRCDWDPTKLGIALQPETG